MNFNYRYIGFCNVSEMSKKISSLDQSVWDEDSTRQDSFYNHKDTKTIMLMWDLNSLYDNSKGKIHSHYHELEIDSFLDKIKPIYLLKYGEGDFVRVLIVNLLPGGGIPPHKDEGNGLEKCRRTHIAIKTNPLVLFNVGGEIKHLDSGEIWEINNQNMHAVINDSDKDRWHFIIDYLQE